MNQQILPRDLQLPVREPVNFLGRNFGKTSQKDFSTKGNEFFKQNFQSQSGVAQQLQRPTVDADFNNVLSGICTRFR